MFSCKTHKRRRLEKEWTSRGYPEFTFRVLVTIWKTSDRTFPTMQRRICFCHISPFGKCPSLSNSMPAVFLKEAFFSNLPILRLLFQPWQSGDIYPSRLLWRELPSFGATGWRNVCFLSSIMELDGTWLMVLRAPANYIWNIQQRRFILRTSRPGYSRQSQALLWASRPSVDGHFLLHSNTKRI